MSGGRLCTAASRVFRLAAVATGHRSLAFALRGHCSTVCQCREACRCVSRNVARHREAQRSRKSLWSIPGLTDFPMWGSQNRWPGIMCLAYDFRGRRSRTLPPTRSRRLRLPPCIRPLAEQPLLHQTKVAYLRIDTLIHDVIHPQHQYLS